MLAFMVLIGCSSDGAWLNDSISCEADPYDGWGGLTYWTDYGTTESATPRSLDFSIEPGEPWIQSVDGTYNTANGNFDYLVKFAPDYFLSRLRTDPDFDNYGTAYRNGNLDIRERIEVEDSLGEVTRFIRRETRSGCTGEIRTRFGRDTDDGEIYPKYPDEVTEYTIGSGARIDFERTADWGEGWVEEGEGSWRADFTTTEDVTRDYDDGASYEATRETDATGKQNTSWSQTDGDLDFEGDTTRRVDGSVKASYLVEYKGDDFVTITYDVAYDGSGSGAETWHRVDKTCETTFDDEGNCERDCSGDCYEEP